MVVSTIGITDYSIYYTIKDYEYKKLMDILPNTENDYSAFLIIMLKELEGDINRALRIISVGIKSKKRIFNTAMANFLLTSIKEAIILSNYSKFKQKDGFISASEVSKNERFRVADIDRQTVIRTFKKYGIDYNNKNRRS